MGYHLRKHRLAPLIDCKIICGIAHLTDAFGVKKEPRIYGPTPNQKAPLRSNSGSFDLEPGALPIVSSQELLPREKAIFCPNYYKLCMM